MDPTVVLFAIEAGVRVGRRLTDALVDATHSRPLLLPVGELFGAVIDSEAIEFFDRDEHQPLTAPGGPYAGCDRAQLITAYRTLRRVEVALGSDGPATARDAILRLHALEQLKRDPATPAFLQQVVGDVVSLGIDYFTVNPGALGRDSPARAIVQGLLREIDHTDLAATPLSAVADGIVGHLLGAALNTLQSTPALLADDARLQALLGGVTRAALAELADSRSAGDRLRRQDLLRRTFAAALQGGAAALDGQLDAFLPSGNAATPLVRDALRDVLTGIRAHPGLFPNDAVQRLVRAALGMGCAHLAAAAPAAARPWLGPLITGVTESLLHREGGHLFDARALAPLLESAIHTAARHLESLARENPAHAPVFARALDALGAGLGGDAGAAAALPGALLLEFTRGVFEDVAQAPAALLGDATDPHRTALAQIVGAVAAVLAEDPTAPLSGHGRLELLQIARATALQNLPRLLAPGDPSPRANPLFALLQPLVAAWRRAPPAFGAEPVLIDLVRRVLPLASANAGMLVQRHDLPARVLAQAFELAQGAFDGRVDARTLPILAEGLLRDVLWEELDPDDAGAVAQVARRLLRAA